MARPRKKWRDSVGEHGETVSMWEPRLAAPLRWDYRDPITGKRTRPEVKPRMVVRRRETDPEDPTLVRRAREEMKRKAHELGVQPASDAKERPLTVGDAYRLFFEPRRKALPDSVEARNHHKASREFWEHELGADTPWSEVPPNDVNAALLRLRDGGKIATAEKRLANLRTLYHWLVEEMGLELRDPARGHRKLKKKLSAGYQPKRPRLTPEELRALRKALPRFSWRTRLFFTLLVSSGTRGVQARRAMRSGLNHPLEPPPPAGFAPHGWFLFEAVKDQLPHLTALTAAQRAEIDAAISGPLAAWEAQYQAGEITDYPLVPGGRVDRDQLTMSPISDNGIRKELDTIFAAAGIPPRDRLGLHAVRRGWADIVNERLGIGVVKGAGGWSRVETAEGYLSPYQFGQIDQARELMEEK